MWRQENAVLVQHSLETVQAVKNHDVGIEIIDSLGTMAGGDVLERRPLHGRAELDQPVFEDPRPKVFDRQIANIDDTVKCGPGLRGALGHVV